MWRFGIPALVALTILPLLVCIGAALVLPEVVPLHMDFSGEINRWGNKGEFLFIMGGVSLFCNVLCSLCYVFAPTLKRYNLLNSPKDSITIARWILLGTMVFCDVLIIGIIIWFTNIALAAV